MPLFPEECKKFSLQMVSALMFMTYFVVICITIVMGSEERMKIGELRDWGQAECEPLYHSSASKGNSARCTQLNDKSRKQYFWKKIHAKDGNEFCDPETVVSQADRVCGYKEDYRDWPVSEYGDDFVNNNQTHPCWTNCNKHMTSVPEETFQKAQTHVIVGYVLLLFLPLIQLVVLPFPYLRKIVVFAIWYWIPVRKQDYIGRQKHNLSKKDYLGRQKHNQNQNDVFFTFISIMLGLYVTYIVSTFNCLFFISDTCPIMSTGYFFEFCMQSWVFFIGMFGATPPPVTCFNVKCNGLFCFFCASFTCIIITVPFTIDNFMFDLYQNQIIIDIARRRHCFKPSWCDIQVYFIPVWYFLALVGFLVYQFKEEYEPLILKNNSKRFFMEIVEQKWQAQKDIIFPLIDEREHIWNEIWTMCWNMEEVFWNRETRNEQYCDLLLAGYEGSESPACFYTIPSYKFCCIPVINDYLAMIVRTKSSKISLISVAKAKGDINWNVYEFERRLPKSRNSFREQGRAALWTGGVRDSVRVPPRPQKSSHRPERRRPPMEVGSLMKIRGAEKYNGKLVRVIEELDSNKIRVRFENNPLKIIQIPSGCLEEFTLSRLMAAFDKGGFDNLAIDTNCIEPYYDAHQIPVQVKKQCTVLEALEDSDRMATPSEVASRCDFSIEYLMEQVGSLGVNSLMTIWIALSAGFIAMQPTLESEDNTRCDELLI